MIVTRQLRLGAERASRRLGSSVRLVVRRVAFLLEPGYPHDDPEFVEDHRDRMARKFSAEVGAKGKSRWEDLTPEQREALLRFIRGRKNCGQNAADRSLTAWGEDVGIAFREKACPARCPAADAPRDRGDREQDRLNTSSVHSHRLVKWAARHGGPDKCEEVFEIINRRHFEDGYKLNDHEMLADTAAEAGLDRDAVSPI
jgi:predicted DsbA family dithiol-disulfide isomerase